MKPALEETKFYATCQCKETALSEAVSCGNLQTYEQSSLITYAGVLIHENEHFPALSQIRAALITDVIAEMNKYFKISEFEKYEPFDPKNLPINCFDVPTHESMQSIIQLAPDFGLEG